MIKSILENDLYKFSMGHYYQMMYPDAIGTFTFKDRNNLTFDKMFLITLQNEFRRLSELALTDEECEWAIENIPYIPRHYWEWLKTFRFEPEKIKSWLDEENHLHVEVTDIIYKVTMYEIPILSIVSETYYRYHSMHLSNVEYQVAQPLREKIELAKQSGIKFAEFGMRRRYSHDVEDKVMEILSKECPNCVGTSTVYFAKKYGTKVIGTMAHELFMATAALTSPKEANYIVMENWSKVYDGNLGTVLTDTYTVDAFLRAFSMKLAKLYDGVRHDSGDPIEFGEKIIKKYESYGIDPRSKSIIFSDSLNFEKAAEIAEHFKGRIKVSFGIGTNLTNELYDVDDHRRIPPMNIVMKLKDFQVNPRQPKYGCVKLSDVPSKAIGTEGDIANYKYQLGIESAFRKEAYWLGRK